MPRATNTEIIEKLERMEARLPNGELKEIQEDLQDIKEILLDIRNENKGIWTESLNNILTTYNGITVRDSVERLAESKLNDFKNVNKKFADIAGATFPSNFNDPDNGNYGNYNQVLQNC